MSAPVAYRVKDFGDGWILCHTLEQAEREAKGCRNLIEPLLRQDGEPAMTTFALMIDALEAQANDVYRHFPNRDGSLRPTTVAPTALLTEAAAALRDVGALVEAAREIDRWLLVIESAVRRGEPRDHPAILAALKANRAALESGGR